MTRRYPAVARCPGRILNPGRCRRTTSPLSQPRRVTARRAPFGDVPAALVKTLAVFPPGSYSSTPFNRKTLYSPACGMAAPARLCR